MNKDQLKNIKLPVLDMDGVMTDSGIYLFTNGEQARRFNAKDGEGLKRLQRKGIKVAILTGSKEDSIVLGRSKMLNIAEQLVSINTADKLAILKQWSEQEQISFEQMAYIGDDLPDVEVLQAVGIGACPNDAVPQVKKVSDIVLTKNGGQGCVREFVDYFLED